MKETIANDIEHMLLFVRDRECFKIDLTKITISKHEGNSDM